VSLKLTAICIIDRTGKIEREGVVASDPEAIAARELAAMSQFDPNRTFQSRTFSVAG
jgi:hypothetical protein